MALTWRRLVRGACGAMLLAFLLPATAFAAVPAPRDVDYPGTLRLDVDATDLDHRIFRVRQEIPVTAGPFTLLYPQWVPGGHSPRGPVEKLAGLQIRAGDVALAWTRDPVEMAAFHVEVPEGTTRLTVEFQFLSPLDGAQGRRMMTPDMLNLQWNMMALYPAGHFARRITVEPSVRLPAGWQFASALEVAPGETSNATGAGGVVRFKPVDFDTLVDSPIFAGRHFKRVELAGGKAPVHLNIVADEAADLAITPAQIKVHQELVTQARKLFASEHYDHYEFLLALSSQLGGIGLEHHRSSENGVKRGYFTEWDRHAPGRDLLAHEYTHSWNGKFRRPAGLATPNFNVPMQGELLWVYEGQTQYWGFVLAARSGLWSAAEARDALALVAANYSENRPGFAWRNVLDTTRDPVIAQRRPLPYRNWQMSEDYYSAGQLVWLAVDAKLRELSRGKRSLDDFARAFFGIDDGSWAVSSYDFEDVVAALDGVAPFDWAAFLRQRIEGHAPPLDGLAAAGWQLAWRDEPSAFQKKNETDRKSLDYSASLGLIVDSGSGRVADVRWDGPAFKAGLAPASALVAVNGREFNADRIKAAVAATRGGSETVELLVKNGEEYRTLKVTYRGGLRYPHLERIPGTPDRLEAILAPR
ncbi:MAG: M61 family metallopeptidase [Xanthomonadales bacterium]|nr:M61 family metallopeptidase [Xanthomonadales bacterium]